MSDANRATALAFLAAMDKGDAPGMATCLTEDATTVTKGFAGVSGWRNRETMLATTDAFRDVIPDGFGLKILTSVAEGDTVVVEFEGNAVLSNGVPYANQYCFMFFFAGGKIQRVHEYLCTVLADRAIMPLLAAKGEELAHGNG
jgi:ketosteroid isomerase-like protein